MSVFRDLPTSDIEIVNARGQLVAKTKATIVPKSIVVADAKILISAGDEIRRRLPSGQDDVFEVTDPTFVKRFHDIPAHYQLKYRRKGTFNHGEGGNYTFHVSGNNARVNIRSHDQSSNVLVQGDIFGNVTSALWAGVQDQNELPQLLHAVEECAASCKESPPRHELFHGSTPPRLCASVHEELPPSRAKRVSASHPHPRHEGVAAQFGDLHPRQ